MQPWPFVSLRRWSAVGRRRFATFCFGWILVRLRHFHLGPFAFENWAIRDSRLKKSQWLERVESTYWDFNDALHVLTLYFIVKVKEPSKVIDGFEFKSSILAPTRDSPLSSHGSNTLALTFSFCASIFLFRSIFHLHHCV